MLSKQDLNQISARGISEEMVEHQLQDFKQGFPFLKIEAAAAIGNGIFKPTEEEVKKYVADWTDYLSSDHSVVKFVPASGAASRMFKDLFAFLSAPYDVPTTDFEKTFFDNIKKFAFKKALCAECKKNDGGCVCDLTKAGNYKAVVANLLEAKGLNYGQLPKGLLLFHQYEDGPRTPMEEHLVEAALYASTNGNANIHFTVSHDHLELFKNKVAEKIAYYEQKFGIKYNVSFSEQKPSTDTIAANPDNTPFRNEDGSLLFRPGGHGALIQNLNEIDADVVFVKNIDNVVPDRIKDETVLYKKLIAGILVDTQKQVFAYLRLLESGAYTDAQLEEMVSFLEGRLCCHKHDVKSLSREQLADYLRTKFSRPIRVCGMVRNQGEPGGGPFIIAGKDGSSNLQILESVQINMEDERSRDILSRATHFNPVDLVCCIRNYKGDKFNLLDFVDEDAGFMSSKSYQGRDLKALELPGLWNGSMSDWNTCFVEVPLDTFNPVKVVLDLLRPAHQG